MAQKVKLSFENKLPYISVINEASDFKFGMQLEFAKAHHQIPSSNPTRRKSRRGLGQREIPKILEFPYNISATAEASIFKFGAQLGFPGPS